LNAILGAANLLSETPLNRDQAEYVNMFQRNCARLVTLINDFLDFSKIEAGALKLERIPFRVRETVEDAVAMFRESAARKGVALSVDIASDVPDWEMGDPLRVQQVVVNLLSNAIKFTEQGRVSVQVARSMGLAVDSLRFEVADTGPGIRPEDQERIFGAFTQLPGQTAGRTAGCGLGLAICRELVERMGGEIGITSELGRGSRFHFQFPLEAAQPRDTGRVAAAPSPEPQENGILRVLVAEDAEDNRLLLKHYLRGEPLEVRFAADGREAVNEIQSGAKFDLILMDLDMPELNGYEATRMIHEWQKSHHEILTPIVALSAHAMRDAEQACLAAGCSAHVAKPVDRATLLSAICRYARSRKTLELNNNAVNDAINSLVPKFLASKPKQIEEARAALAVKEFDPIRRFGHNLKGTGRGYGFPAIEEIGREIEQAAAKGDEESIAQQLANLYEFVASVPAAGVTASS
jgi:CheY-like chemotaxis protein